MSSTSGKVREHELYPTPKDTIESLFKHLVLRSTDTFLEPCRACGAIYNTIGLPEEQKDWAEIREGRDYLTHDFGKKFDVIITNPPFSLTTEFLAKSKSELAEGGTLIYLQRVNFLGSIKRRPFWQEFGTPEKLGVIVPRPRFVAGGSDSCEYAWFIWDEGGRVRLDKGVSIVSHLN